MAFPDAWLDELLAKNDIVSVISSYMQLKPKGRRLWGLCPIHGEKTASFSVSPDKQMFYCFGCHAGGTVIQFVMQVERLNFQEAVRFLAERAGMEMPSMGDDAALRRQRAYKERLYEACQHAARYFMENLLGQEGVPAREYLVRRGLSSDSVKRFGIGYALDSWDAMKNRLMGEGFTQQELLDAGLLVHNPQKNTVYDAYRNRVIFPILGTNGKVLGFGARVLNNDKPKYINTGDTPLYNKRNNLYGLNLQKGVKSTDLVMVEGYTDVIGLYAAGITNAVASLGTALTVQQARLLKRYVPTVYIAYDGDAAGQNATIRGLDILIAEGLDVRVIVFPDGKDPDEFIRSSGKEAFDQLKDHALSLNAFKLEALSRTFDLTAENDRERYAVEACAFIAGLQPVERDRYFVQVARKTGYALEALQEQGSAAGVRRQETPHRPGFARRTNTTLHSPEENERTRAESTLLRAMLQSGEAANEAATNGAMELFSNPVYAGICMDILSAYAVEEKPNLTRILASHSEEDTAAAAALLREDEALADANKTAADCIGSIRRFAIQQTIGELTDRLTDVSITPEQRADLLQQIQNLSRSLKG